MIEINLTIVIQVLQFLILVFILNRLLFKPISQVIAERQDKIIAWEEKTSSLQESVRTRLESYESHLQEAQAQAQERQGQLKNEVKEKEEERLRAVSEEAARLVDSTKLELEKETERLRAELRQQAKEMSKVLAAKILGRKVP
ncbi:MAG: ATP synthase F0 subunit B [Deltaproteobacteria bacterium]|nr:MAG: ATP synthase F0 subunit B [Deltaproteobacteria bacterium]